MGWRCSWRRWAWTGSYSENIQRKKTKVTAWRTVAASSSVFRGLCHLPRPLWLSLSLSHHIPLVILGTHLLATCFGFFGPAVLSSSHAFPQLSTSVPLSHCSGSDVLSPSERAVFWSPSSSETPHLTVTLYQLCLALFRCPGLMTLWHRLTRFFIYSFTVPSLLFLPPSVLDCRFHEMRDHCHCCIYWQIAGAPQMLVEWMNEFQTGVEESYGEGNGNPL